MITILLAGLAVVLAVIVPSALARARWPYRSPWLGLLAWQATGAAALTATIAATTAALLHPRPGRGVLAGVWRLCLDALSGAHGRAGQGVAIAGLGLLAVMLIRLAAGSRRLVEAVHRRQRHRRMLRLVGQTRTDLGITVLTHPEPAAYLLPGRPDRVVVTSGALQRLPQPELAAVLAHERAHAAGHHHRLCALAGVLRYAFPRVPAFTHGQAQITRLVELCADDVAARAQSPLALARALVVMAEAVATPTGTLPASGGVTRERITRLLQPPRRLPATVRAAVAVAFSALPLVPAVVVLGEPLTHLSPFTW